MRVLILGSRHPWRMEVAVQHALVRAGHQVEVFDDRRSARMVGHRLTQRRALRAAKRFRPDFVFLSKCHRLALETVAAIIAGVPNAMWFHDAPYHTELHRPEIAHYAAVGRLSEVFFVTGFVEEWRAHGLPAAFLPSAGALEITPVPADPAWRTDASFIGAGYDTSRAEFLMRLAKVHGVRVYGPGWEPWRDQLAWNGGEVAGDAFSRACTSAAFSLGILPKIAAGTTTYASDRMWMVMLAGGLYLGPRTPGLDAFLLDEEHCVWYDDIDDCIARMGRLLPDIERRAAIRASGEAFVRAHHTYDARVPFLLGRRGWENPLAARKPGG
ncbi:MAG: glycosyltransferase [Gemmatimonadaceae bacterium]|nr:glycosyltransferase [Gemmatimonadaceae bacterium]